jgi:hypothetical protein
VASRFPRILVLAEVKKLAFNLGRNLVLPFNFWGEDLTYCSFLLRGYSPHLVMG